MLHLDAAPGAFARVWLVLKLGKRIEEVNHYMELHLPRVERGTTVQVLQTWFVSLFS